MKKYIAILAISLLALVSCDKQFEVNDSSVLSGSEAIAMVEQDPSFLASYINGFYAWMVEFNTGGGSHGDFGHLGCVYNTDMMGLEDRKSVV